VLPTYEGAVSWSWWSSCGPARASAAMTEFTEQRFERLRGRLGASGVSFERCVFDSCTARGGTARGLRLVDCTAWACSLHDVVLEDCELENLKMSSGRGGRTMPLFVWGGAMRRVGVRGPIGGVIWNPPRDGRQNAAVRCYYDEVDDWALDVTDARFRSVPGLDATASRPRSGTGGAPSGSAPGSESGASSSRASSSATGRTTSC
jgi:hypothetical protein